MRNCLTASIAIRWRLYRCGRVASIQFRKSRHGWFPHFLVATPRPITGSIRFISYVPVVPRDDLLCPPPSFQGRIKWGDQR